MTTYFNTRPYETAHGKAPKGRGCWAFAPESNRDAVYIAPGCLTYGEAKKNAAAHFAALGINFIVTLS
jgi:hypothetical protein